MFSGTKNANLKKMYIDTDRDAETSVSPLKSTPLCKGANKKDRATWFLIFAPKKLLLQKKGHPFFYNNLVFLPMDVQWDSVLFLETQKDPLTLDRTSSKWAPPPWGKVYNPLGLSLCLDLFHYQNLLETHNATVDNMLLNWGGLLQNWILMFDEH